MSTKTSQNPINRRTFGQKIYNKFSFLPGAEERQRKLNIQRRTYQSGISAETVELGKLDNFVKNKIKKIVKTEGVDPYNKLISDLNDMISLIGSLKNQVKEELPLKYNTFTKTKDTDQRAKQTAKSNLRFTLSEIHNILFNIDMIYFLFMKEALRDEPLNIQIENFDNFDDIEEVFNNLINSAFSSLVNDKTLIIGLTNFINSQPDYKEEENPLKKFYLDRVFPPNKIELHAYDLLLSEIFTKAQPYDIVKNLVKVDFDTSTKINETSYEEIINYYMKQIYLCDIYNEDILKLNSAKNNIVKNLIDKTKKSLEFEKFRQKLNTYNNLMKDEKCVEDKIKLFNFFLDKKDVIFNQIKSKTNQALITESENEAKILATLTKLINNYNVEMTGNNEYENLNNLSGGATSFNPLKTLSSNKTYHRGRALENLYKYYKKMIENGQSKNDAINYIAALIKNEKGLNLEQYYTPGSKYRQNALIRQELIKLWESDFSFNKVIDYRIMDKETQFKEFEKQFKRIFSDFIDEKRKELKLNIEKENKGKLGDFKDENIKKFLGDFKLLDIDGIEDQFKDLSSKFEILNSYVSKFLNKVKEYNLIKPESVTNNLIKKSLEKKKDFYENEIKNFALKILEQIYSIDFSFFKIMENALSYESIHVQIKNFSNFDTIESALNSLLRSSLKPLNNQNIKSKFEKYTNFDPTTFELHSYDMILLAIFVNSDIYNIVYKTFTMYPKEGEELRLFLTKHGQLFREEFPAIQQMSNGENKNKEIKTLYKRIINDFRLKTERKNFPTKLRDYIGDEKNKKADRKPETITIFDASLVTIAEEVTKNVNEQMKEDKLEFDKIVHFNNQNGNRILKYKLETYLESSCK